MEMIQNLFRCKVGGDFNLYTVCTGDTVCRVREKTSVNRNRKAVFKNLTTQDLQIFVNGSGGKKSIFLFSSNRATLPLMYGVISLEIRGVESWFRVRFPFT